MSGTLQILLGISEIGISDQLWGWGGTDNQIGTGTGGTRRSSPVQVPGINWALMNGNELRLNSSSASGGAIKTDGTLWTWGGNVQGQLGQNNTTTYTTPRQVGALTNWAKLNFTGNQTVIAIKTDGTLWGWGASAGVNDAILRSSPVQVGSLTIWSETMGEWSVRTDGRLYAWGSNGRGQLGLGDTTSKSSPIQVGSLTNWLRPVSRHDTTNGALKTDGSLWTAGDQSVKGTLNNFIVPSPVQVSGSQGWAKVNMRGAAIGVKTNGTLWTWGDNGDGALGNGSVGYFTGASCPVQVGALTNWNNTSLGNDAVNGNFSYTNQAIKTDGTLWIWGKGSTGLLNNSSRTNRYSPVQMGALNTWTGLGAASPNFGIKKSR